MPRFKNPIEYQFAGEAAAALGRSGRLLKKALEALQKYDGDVLSGARRADPGVRSRLVATAGEAFWGYVVQRETLGLLDPEYIAKEYGVPLEVQQAMGPKMRPSGP